MWDTCRMKTGLSLFVRSALLGAAASLAACSGGETDENMGTVRQRVGATEDASRKNPDATKGGTSASKDRYIVLFKPGTIDRARNDAANGSASALKAALHERFNATPRRVYSTVLEGMAVSLPERAARARLENDPNVARIIPDEVMSLDATQVLPDITYWGLDRIDQREWYTVIEPSDAPSDSLYHYDGTGKGVHVYIIDTGLNQTHDEFTGRVLGGYDAYEDDFSPDDCNGHGTHVAGIAVGATRGVAKEAFVHPVRVVDCGTAYALSDALAGLDWVGANLQQPAVVNMSLGGPHNDVYNDAVTNLIAQGATVVVSAGNNYRADACDKSPASTPQALTVGATFLWDNLSSFTNIGSCVDLFAPGENITSAWIGANDAEDLLSGTSQAAPHVAGVAALLVGQYPDLTPAQVHTEIVAQATPNTLVGSEPFYDVETDSYIAQPFPTGSPDLNLYMGDINTVGRGALFLGDREAACFDGVEVIVRDVDLSGAGSVTVAIAASTGDQEQLTLAEVAPNSGEFSAVVNLAAETAVPNDGVVQTAPDGTVSVTYQDADAGNGSSANIIGELSIDCTAPRLAGIHASDVFSTGADIAFDLSEYANVTVNYGTDCSSLSEATPPRGSSPEEASISLRNLTADTKYFYTLTAVDRAGNTEVFDNEQMCYEFTTGLDIYHEDFESTVVLIPGSTWHTSTSCNAALPGHSPSTILYSGSDGACNYDNDVAEVDTYTTPTIPVDFDDNPTLSFNYMLELGAGDEGRVELVIDGGSPIVVASSTFESHERGVLSRVGHWREVALSLDGYGTGPADIQLRFVLDHDEVSNSFDGFSVDDIVVAGGGCKPEIYEAEEMLQATGGPHPLGWNIWDNGYISFDHDFEGGSQHMVVTAEGAYAGGAWPHMVVWVDGNEVFDTDVATTEWTDYGFWFNAPAGNAEVRIYFTNDYYENGEDRNLFIEKVIVPCDATPPANGGTLAAQFDYFSTWPTGYCARLSLTNNGTVPTTSWQAVIDTGTGYTFTSWNPNYPNSTGIHNVNSVNDVNSIIQVGQTLPVDRQHGFCVENGAPPALPSLMSLTASY